MKRFSIIIPTYNSEQYLNYCLDSVVAQKYPNLQIVIVDNCSTDKTADIIDTYRDRLEICMQSEPDSGINDAFRKGLLRSDGEYVCHMCSTDSYASPRWFYDANEMIAQLDNCDVLISDSALEIDEESIPLFFWKPWVSKFMRKIPNNLRIEFSKFIGLSYPDMGWLAKRNFAITNFPSETDQAKYGLYAPFLGYMENIYIRGACVVIVPSVTSTGRHHEGQWTYKVKDETKIAKRCFRTRLFINFINNNFNKITIYQIAALLPVYFLYFLIYGGIGSILDKFRIGKSK